MALAHRVKPGEKIALRAIDPGQTGGLSKKQGAARLEALNAELTALQEIHYAAGQSGILIVLQGLDTAGKDGTIGHVMAQFNPSGCQVTAFKAPTAEELSHDFLWRIHRATPEKGCIGIFNRSHYEDVLVVRVHELAPKAVWERRYARINEFERLLVESGAIVLKFFLHISKEEQRERLLARENDREKAWKLSTTDWPEHDRYDQYQDAYEDALSRCSTADAPWYVVPADHKWYRNLAVAQTIVDVLTPHRRRWEKELVERGRVQLAARAAQRATGAAPNDHP